MRAAICFYLRLCLALCASSTLCPHTAACVRLVVASRPARHTAHERRRAKIEANPGTNISLSNVLRSTFASARRASALRSSNVPLLVLALWTVILRLYYLHYTCVFVAVVSLFSSSTLLNVCSVISRARNFVFGFRHSNGRGPFTYRTIGGGGRPAYRPL